ncbi:MAG: MarC family protein [Actinomycetales bacterium]|nr:MarC family protein [Actinomycetales bacterium]
MKDVSTLTFALQAFVTLMVILDPPGNAPIFLAVLGDRSAKEGRQLAVQAATISFLIIAGFALFGRFLLDYMDVSIGAMQAAGGLLLLMVSLNLLTGKEDNELTSGSKNVAMVPLATPLLAGPGAIVAVMIFAHQVKSFDMGVALAASVIAVHVFVALALMASTFILKLIGKAGVDLLARIAGLVLSGIAVQMLANAIHALA